MLRRIVATGVFLAFSLGAFVYGGPMQPGPFNPFGYLCLLFAVIVWRKWDIIAGSHSKGLWDGFAVGLVDRAGSDDHRR